jgi:hypothetical protein
MPAGRPADRIATVIRLARITLADLDRLPSGHCLARVRLQIRLARSLAAASQDVDRAMNVALFSGESLVASRSDPAMSRQDRAELQGAYHASLARFEAALRAAPIVRSNVRRS